MRKSDGNLVIYTQSGQALWSSITAGYGPSSAILQTDGNFVIYNSTRATWSSNTHGLASAQLLMQNDGNVVIYTAAGVPLWHTGTGGH
ncbi:hypothetical protein [Lysobacter antibioticus]|uniref:hypothetical protein n=1 Tax=Lysobacter antibioticus TaxID=84531 RepID=UPI00034D6755|nr:hypothetical protein [Lysobacter antibioticus]